MLEDITTGNTITDGKEFRFWIVGRVEEWRREARLRSEGDYVDLESVNECAVVD